MWKVYLLKKKTRRAFFEAQISKCRPFFICIPFGRFIRQKSFQLGAIHLTSCNIWSSLANYAVFPTNRWGIMILFRVLMGPEDKSQTKREKERLSITSIRWKRAPTVNSLDRRHIQYAYREPTLMYCDLFVISFWAQYANGALFSHALLKHNADHFQYKLICATFRIQKVKVIETFSSNTLCRHFSFFLLVKE